MASSSKKRKGASSSRSAPQFDDSRFRDEKAELWFNEHVESEFLVERSIDPSLDETFGITTMFAQLGLESVVTDLTGEYSPILVREFYANIKDRETYAESRYPMIESVIRGRSVRVNDNIINQFFGIRKGHVRMSFKRNNFTVKGNDYILPTREELAAKLGAEVGAVNDTRPGRTPEKFIDRELVTPEIFIASEILRRNIFPRKENMKRLRISEAFLLSIFFQPDPAIDWFDFGAAVMAGIGSSATSKQKNKTLAFPLLISKLIQDNGIVLVDPIVANEVLTIENSLGSNKRLFKQVNGVYYNVARMTKMGMWKNNAPCEAEEAAEEQAYMGDAERRDDQGVGSSYAPAAAGPIYSVENMFDYMQYTNQNVAYHSELGTYNTISSLSQYFDGVRIGDYQFPHMPVPPMPEPPMLPEFMRQPPPQQPESGGDFDGGDEEW